MNGQRLSQLAVAGFQPIVTGVDGFLAASDAMRFNATDPTVHWFVIGPGDTELHPDVLDKLVRASRQRPDVGIFYGDEVTIAQGGEQTLTLKPDWDFALFLSQGYVGLPVFVRAQLAKVVGGLDTGRGTAAVYDLVLRSHAAGVPIARIADVLALYSVSKPRATEADRRSAIDGYAARSGHTLDVTPGLAPGSLRIDKRFSQLPDVTIVVPTRQSLPDPSLDGSTQPHIVNFLDSLALSDYPMDRIQVLIGDDTDDDTIYEGWRWPFAWRRIVMTRPAGERFNYAAKMNRLWREAETDNVIMVNDDVTVESVDWIQALLTFSTEADVGGVGARLLYPDGRIQHAGMPGGVHGLVTHAWIGEAADAPTYEDWAIVQREWSMVTGAVFATRRSLLEEVNGFDERFSLDFNDADLCLRLRMLGYRIVYTPHAELVHHEKGSRGSATWPASELSLFLKRWAAFLGLDPSFHPQLSKTTHKIRPASPVGKWWDSRS